MRQEWEFFRFQGDFSAVFFAIWVRVGGEIDDKDIGVLIFELGSSVTQKVET